VKDQMRAIRWSSAITQDRLLAAGYKSIFCHPQGGGNMTILWVNLETGDFLLTMSMRGPIVSGVDYKGTTIYRLSIITLEEVLEAASTPQEGEV
jgi:hypothetical protein